MNKWNRWDSGRIEARNNPLVWTRLSTFLKIKEFCDERTLAQALSDINGRVRRELGSVTDLLSEQILEELEQQ